jgi:endonuclease YncB( thermonuclease family)
MNCKLRTVLLLFCAVTAPAAASNAQTIVGKARIVDGNAIEINRQQIRLFGISAPAPSQTCTAKGVQWACGQNATFALSAIVERQWVHCRQKSSHGNGLVIAVCRLAGDNGPDIGAAMVRQGWALAYPRQSSVYAVEENAARKAKSGLWVGEFVAPWEWRRRDRPKSGAAE